MKKEFTSGESVIGLIGTAIIIFAGFVDHPWGAILAFIGTTLLAAAVLAGDRRNRK